jgi:hypothetical protein
LDIVGSERLAHNSEATFTLDKIVQLNLGDQTILVGIDKKENECELLVSNLFTCH